MTKITWTDRDGKERTYRPSEEIGRYIRALGIDNAAEFFLKYGGGPFYVSRGTPSNAVYKMFGPETASNMFREFGNGQVGRVPLANEFLIPLYASRGLSIVEIGRRLRVADETVRHHLWSKEKKFDRRLKVARRMKEYGTWFIEAADGERAA
ncbi:hypothetical protein AB4Z13_15450 [Rhizobium sp. YAF28]|uniref:hypothetical protein n=1 Tax=Rhizobium sp. YAF28 TaxID=3233081 RepID=UPI003F9BD817